MAIVNAPLLNGLDAGQPSLEARDVTPSLAAVSPTISLSAVVAQSTTFVPSLDFSDPLNSQYIPGLL